MLASLAPATLGRPSTEKAVACAHCTLPVPAGLIRAGREEQFCCHGCEMAYSVIHSCGLDRYYALREAASGSGERKGPARGTSRKYAEFDDPAFRALYCRAIPGGRAGVELFLQGVHCAACVWLVEKLPRVLPGVVSARLDMRRALVQIEWDEPAVSLSRIARVLDSIGYPPHPAREAGAREARRIADRKAMVHIGVAGACAGNVMLLALALYAGMFDAMEAQYLQLFRWTSMALSLVSLLWPGRVFFRGAWAAIRTRTLHLDVPIALGLGAGGGVGACQHDSGDG